MNMHVQTSPDSGTISGLSEGQWGRARTTCKNAGHRGGGRAHPFGSARSGSHEAIDEGDGAYLRRRLDRAQGTITFKDNFVMRVTVNVNRLASLGKMRRMPRRHNAQ